MKRKHPSLEESARARPARDKHEDSNAMVLGASSIGPYRVREILRHTPEGDTYVVATSEQAPEVEVAIRILPSGHTLDSQDICSEEQDLLLPAHPSIARRLDSGTTADGRAYFVQEYVRGTPIDRYCERRHLSLEERLSLFGKVCEAVDFAHRFFVPHYDLKPANILITPSGEPFLLDFGISSALHWRFTQKLDPTSSGSELRHPLTPRYAAPEQFRQIALGQASEVYTLGVLLYELLTGQLPYSNTNPSVWSWARIVSRQDPEMPSRMVGEAKGTGDTSSSHGRGERSSTARTLQRQLRGDLDSILMRALAKDPRERFPTVGGLAGDLERHLDGRTVSARRGERLYGFLKYLRRNLLLLVVTMSLLAMCFLLM